MYSSSTLSARSAITSYFANFGIVEPLGYKVKGGKVAKYEVVAERALKALDEYIEKYEFVGNNSNPTNIEE